MSAKSPKGVIALVEDDEGIRDTFAEVLLNEGYEVLAFANGREALEGLRAQNEPCLILLDWMMPVMNGEEFLMARNTSNDPKLCHSPVVVVSAMARWMKRLPGMADLVDKPVDLESLLKVVRAHSVSEVQRTVV